MSISPSSCTLPTFTQSALLAGAGSASAATTLPEEGTAPLEWSFFSFPDMNKKINSYLCQRY